MRVERSAFHECKSRRLISTGQKSREVCGRKFGKIKAFELGLIAGWVDADHDLQKAFGCGDAAEAGENRSIRCCYRAKETAPGEMDVDLVSRAV